MYAAVIHYIHGPNPNPNPNPNLFDVQVDHYYCGRVQLRKVSAKRLSYAA